MGKTRVRDWFVSFCGWTKLLVGESVCSAKKSMIIRGEAGRGVCVCESAECSRGSVKVDLRLDVSIVSMLVSKVEGNEIQQRRRASRA